MIEAIRHRRRQSMPLHISVAVDAHADVPVFEFLVSREIARRKLLAQCTYSGITHTHKETLRSSVSPHIHTRAHARDSAPPACHPPSFCCPTAACHVGRWAVVIFSRFFLL